MESSAIDPLVEVGKIVRRVLAARTNDSHLIEDLAQETVVRVAAVDKQMTPDALCAYSIVIARNLLASHARGESVRGRHAHRLVEYSSLDGPEHLALEQEETDALAKALDSLDPSDRGLLVRHEVDDVDLATISTETGATPGAIAMRLARARAELRLAFLLAFRRVGDIPATCRSVLLALSAGDRRRQRVLDAPTHLLGRPTCAALAQPVTERNRRIAGWLLVPIAEALRRSWSATRNHPTRAVAAAASALALATVGVLALRTEDAAPPAAANSVPSTDRPSDSSSSRATIATSTTPTTAPRSTPPVCPPPQPLDKLDPANAMGCPFAPSRVTVVDVPTDEGLWVSTPTDLEIWVTLVGTGESPVEVRPGNILEISGTVTPSTGPLGGGPPAEDPLAASQEFTLQVGYDQLVVAG